MMEDRIPKEVDDLIARYVRSVGHLEVVLFLMRYPERAWTAEEISREMRTNVSYAERQLADLQGIVVLIDEVPRKYQYAPTENLNAAVQLMDELYGSHRHLLINSIYAKPADSIRSFADSFRLKKGP